MKLWNLDVYLFRHKCFTKIILPYCLRLHLLTLLFVTGILLSLIPVNLESSSFEVVSSSENEIVLEWKLNNYELVSEEIEGQIFHSIEGNFFYYYSKEGFPKIPYLTENVGIPIDGGIELTINRIRQTVKDNIVIRPVDKIRVYDNNEGSSHQKFEEDYHYNRNFDNKIEFYKNQSAYKTNRFYPDDLLTKGITAYAADRRFTSFVFNPFRYNAHDRKLLIIEQATITISITGDTRISNDKDRHGHTRINNRSYIDRTGDLFFLNNEFSQYWRKDREQDHLPLRSNIKEDNIIREIQLIVDQEGIYQVTYKDLQQHLLVWQEELFHKIDFDLDNIDPRHLELSSQYGVTPIYFNGERNGSFDPGDYFEFYGQKNFGREGYQDGYTAENVYTLKISDNWGARMAVESGGIRETNPQNYIKPTSFQQTIHFEEQNTFSSLSTYPSQYREDLWFWKTIRAPDLSVTPFELQYPDQRQGRTFDAEILVLGSTDIGSAEPDHHARIRVNSAFINSHRWRGQREQLFTNQDYLANQALNHKTNYLYIDMPGDTPAGNMEAILLDYFSITYWREYKTNEDYIKFTKPANQPSGLYEFTIENFSQPDIYVYKINSSIIENLQIDAFSESGKAPFSATFQDYTTAVNTEYIAVTSDMKLLPKNIRPRFPSNLKSQNNAADYIIVTTRDFIELEGVQSFKNLWENRGYLVEVVDIQNIFDEFNYGIRSAYAMKDFFSYAYHHWQIPMTDVLLLGKGIYDERDFSSHRHVNLIPYKNIWTYKLGATPSDNWFACIVGDDIVPDFNIARITAWTAEQVNNISEKTRHYLENPNYQDLWQSKITLVAGGKSGDRTDIFAQQNENIRSRWIPEDFDVTRVYSATQTVSDQYQGGTFRLKDSWNSGTSYIQFMGHGGGRIWADYNLLNHNDIATLNNNNFPFVNSLSCYPSDFSRPGVGSIGENMVLTADRGAIAHFGFTGLGYLHEDLLVGYHLTEAIFHRNLATFGDIVSFTKAKTFSSVTNHYARNALVQSAVLFGDPMLSFNLPQDRKEVKLNTYNITEGDTLFIKVDMGHNIQYSRFHIQDRDEITLNVPYGIPVDNGIFTAHYTIPESEEDHYERLIKVYGYANNKQAIAKSRFTVGKSAVTNNVTIPHNPISTDSVYIAANFFDEAGIQNLTCFIKIITPLEDTIYVTSDMIAIEDFDNRQTIDQRRRNNNRNRQILSRTNNNRYITVDPLQSQLPGTFIYYHFVITNNLNQQTKTAVFSKHIAGPDLALENIELSTYNNNPSIKIIVKNLGDYASPATTINLYKREATDDIFIDQKSVRPIQPLESITIHIPVTPLRGVFRFRAHINEDRLFDEASLNNNIAVSQSYALNMFKAGLTEKTIFSLDNNMQIDFPANLLPQEKIFYINSYPFEKPNNQPDVEQVILKNNKPAISYQIGVFNEESDFEPDLSDNKQIRVTIHYGDINKSNDLLADDINFALYRWEDEYRKWVHEGGFTDHSNNIVFNNINRPGTYTLLQNNDNKSPKITANVEDQEFTFGGFISGSGVISLMLSDNNGINIFDDNLQLFLNGVIIPEEYYTLAANPYNINSIPIKYQLNLDAGNYTLNINCSDVNGNYQTHDINFIVNTKFDVLNLANYPNPIVTDSIDPVNSNRTRFTYILTDDADNVKIKVYTVSGRLVKTFSHLPAGVGYHEYPRTALGWNCRDDKGELLANGIYFYKIIASQGNKSVERIQTMAIVR